MKQVIASILFLCCADVSDREDPAIKKKFCYGSYEKIEYGKGIDCNGDTIPIKEFREHYQEYLKYMKQQDINNKLK